MEPNFSNSNASHERSVSSGFESIPQNQLEAPRHREQRPEIEPEHGIERAPATPSTTVLPPPVIAVPSPQTGGQQPVQDDVATMPLTAADDDLIEKEWVDKAKKIVASTKDDPYKREQEVGRLQEDYLRKRYGKELGEAA